MGSWEAMRYTHIIPRIPPELTYFSPASPKLYKPEISSLEHQLELQIDCADDVFLPPPTEGQGELYAGRHYAAR
jgi:hypothetical protein